MELLVMTVDRGLYNKDDVLVVRPDKWPWTKKELECPHWRLVKLPGKAEDYKYLELGEHPDTPDARHRLYKIDAQDSIQIKEAQL